MKKICVKKAARDQLPQLESDRTIELSDKKMANRPEREGREKTLSGHRFQCEDSDVYADQQSCESRHENSLTASANLRTKITKVHDGHNASEIMFTTATQSSRRKKKRDRQIPPATVAAGVSPAFRRTAAGAAAATGSKPLWFSGFADEFQKVSCVPAFLRYLAC
jgi:hypothetical protein